MKVSAAWPTAHELTEGQLQIGDHPVGRGRDRGADEIELCLLDRGERFAKLRIVRALRPELLLGAFELGLGLPDASLGRLDLCRGLVRASFGIDTLLHELEDTRDLLARIVALRCAVTRLSCAELTAAVLAPMAWPTPANLASACCRVICEGLRVDAKQHVAGLRLLIIDNIDLDHPAGNFRGHPHDEGLDGACDV